MIDRLSTLQGTPEEIAALLLVLVLWLGPVVPCWRIARRAGFPGWWSLLVAVPLANMAVVWVFAFIKWRAASR